MVFLLLCLITVEHFFHESHKVYLSVKVTDLKKLPKNSNFVILQKVFNATHILKLLDKMYKYEMDPIRTVGATEWTWDAGRMDGRMAWNQYTPQQLCCANNCTLYLAWYVYNLTVLHIF